MILSQVQSHKYLLPRLLRRCLIIHHNVVCDRALLRFHHSKELHVSRASCHLLLSSFYSGSMVGGNPPRLHIFGREAYLLTQCSFVWRSLAEPLSRFQRWLRNEANKQQRGLATSLFGHSSGEPAPLVP